MLTITHWASVTETVLAVPALPSVGGAYWLVRLCVDVERMERVRGEG